MNITTAVQDNPLLASIKSNTTFTVVMGAILILLGMLAMGAPFVAGISLVFFIGSLLIFGGVVQFFYGIKSGFKFPVVLMGALSVLMGVFMFAQPDVALATLTLFLVFFLIFSGISEIFMAFQLRPAKNWGWALASGIISMVLGIMIWQQFPFSGLWTIGFLVGIKMVFGGWAMLLLGLSAKQEVKAVTA